MKKDKVEDIESDLIQEVDATSPDVVVAVEERPFIAGMWKGFPQWQCRFCPWDTLESEDAMMEHYVARHAPLPVFVAQEVISYDRWGNAVR